MKKENNGDVPTYEAKSGKKSTMDQKLDICNRVYKETDTTWRG